MTSDTHNCAFVMCLQLSTVVRYCYSQGLPFNEQSPPQVPRAILRAGTQAASEWVLVYNKHDVKLTNDRTRSKVLSLRKIECTIGAVAGSREVARVLDGWVVLDQMGRARSAGLCSIGWSLNTTKAWRTLTAKSWRLRSVFCSIRLSVVPRIISMTCDHESWVSNASHVSHSSTTAGNLGKAAERGWPTEVKRGMLQSKGHLASCYLLATVL